MGTCSFGESHRSQLGALQQTRPRTPADRVTAQPSPACPSFMRGTPSWAREHPSRAVLPPGHLWIWAPCSFLFQPLTRRVQAPSRASPSYQPLSRRRGRALPSPRMLVTNAAMYSETPQGQLCRADGSRVLTCLASHHISRGSVR